MLRSLGTFSVLDAPRGAWGDGRGWPDAAHRDTATAAGNLVGFQITGSGFTDGQTVLSPPGV
jgi:hypothetical protein